MNKDELDKAWTEQFERAAREGREAANHLAMIKRTVKESVEESIEKAMEKSGQASLLSKQETTRR